jgi:hypothetical protein
MQTIEVLRSQQLEMSRCSARTARRERAGVEWFRRREARCATRNRPPLHAEGHPRLSSSVVVIDDYKRMEER